MCSRKHYLPWNSSQDEIACFRISETWRKHAASWFRYIYVLRKRENSNLRDSVTSPERKCQVTFPSYLRQHISAVVRFRRVSANGSPVVCYIYKNTNARLFFESVNTPLSIWKKTLLPPPKAFNDNTKWKRTGHSLHGTSSWTCAHKRQCKQKEHFKWWKVFSLCLT